MKKFFNKDFYPTPKEVIDRMMENESVECKKVLEPSAGKGDIVDWMWEHGAADVMACEKDTDLQKLLYGKCTFAGDDFLKLRSEDVSHIDYIVMNPPFAEAEKHILHAWDIAPSGCVIIALKGKKYTSFRNLLLRNKEMDNTERWEVLEMQLNELIENNGVKEELGKVFINAERSTDISVDMVKLYKQGSKENEWEGYFDTEEDLEELSVGKEGIMRYDAIRDLVNRYRMAVDMWNEVDEKANRINELTDTFSKNGIKFHALRYDRLPCARITKEVFKKNLQKDAWKYLFKNLDMERYVTKSVLEKINEFVENQQHIPFTMKNIYKMLSCIVQTHAQRMEQCIAEAFDLICSLSSDNSTAGEKWRTNLNYMVNRRFIIPYICNAYRYDNCPEPYVHIQYEGRSELNDFIRAINYIAGPDRQTEIIDSHVDRLNLEWGKWYDWGEFRVRFYKKGTAHMEFRDEKLWQEFNMRAAKQKGWKIADNARRTNYNKQSA